MAQRAFPFTPLNFNGLEAKSHGDFPGGKSPVVANRINGVLTIAFQVVGLGEPDGQHIDFVSVGAHLDFETLLQPTPQRRECTRLAEIPEQTEKTFHTFSRMTS